MTEGRDRKSITFFAARYSPLLLAVAVTAAAAGLLSGSSWGREDWDYFAHHYEAMRQSILVYGQVPWWDPWNSGGMPLASNPQLGLVSINLPFVLALGTYAGLRWATLVHILIAAEGARWLAGMWLRDPWSRLAVALIYSINGAVALYVAAGHLGIQVIAWVPWAIGLAFRLGVDRGSGIKLGVVMAVAVLTSLQYFTVHLFAVVAVIVVCRLGCAWRGVRAISGTTTDIWTRPQAGMSGLLRDSMWVLAVLLALGGFRLALAAELILDFPRGPFSWIEQDQSLARLLVAVAGPGQGMDYQPPGPFGYGWHEYGCYIGLIPCLLFLASLLRRVCWWHLLAFGCFWMALGNTEWWHISAWLSDVPIWNTMRLASRWRVIGVLGIGLACGQMIDGWMGSARRWVRLSSVLLAILLAIDLIVHSHLMCREAFVVTPKMIHRWDALQPFVQLHNHVPPTKANSAIFATLLANYGVVYGYEPLIGQDDVPQSRLVWFGHPAYRGEYWSDDGPVQLVTWSPNRVVLRAARLATVHVNQNPGSYWLINGVRANRLLRAVDRHEPFRVQADERGMVELVVTPSGWPWGLALTVSGVAAMGVLFFTRRRE